MRSASKRNRDNATNEPYERKKRVAVDQSLIMINSNDDDEKDNTATTSDIQIISVKEYPHSTKEYQNNDDDVYELEGSSSMRAQASKSDRHTDDNVLFLREHHNISLPSTTAESQIPQNSSRIDSRYHDLDAAMARALQQEEYNQAQPQSIPFQRQAMLNLGLDEATINNFLMEENPGLYNRANYVDDNNLDLSYEGLLALSDRIGSVKPKGLPKHLILNLAKKSFVEKDTVIEDKQCVICMTDYNEEETLCGLPCCHYFHEACISTWLKESRFCPICRLDVEKTLE